MNLEYWNRVNIADSIYSSPVSIFDTKKFTKLLTSYSSWVEYRAAYE